ncbi:MAG: Smr/MutS family protein, partial [Prevotella sp.]|nr:Smr/MutS family protein [Prevotella sp.]
CDHSEIDRLNDEKIEKKMQQILARRERKEKRKKEKEQGKSTDSEKLFTAEKSSNASKIAVGNAVRIKGLQSIGKVESISGKTAVVIFGDMRTKMAVERLELAESVKKSKMEQQKENLNAYSISRQTRETIDAHRKNFRQEIDVRGMRGDEALNAVMHFIDDAILTDMSQVRILHGKGDGILRQLIRQYLSTVPNVKHFADEHVQFGGAGITVAEIG